MKKSLIMLLIIVLVLGSCSRGIRTKSTCSKAQTEKTDQSIDTNVSDIEELKETVIDKGKEIVTEEDILKEMKSTDKNWMNLTEKQYLEDFDYLFLQLQKNYPFFGVAERKYDIDLKARYKKTRKLLESCNNDYDFFDLLREEFIPREFIGHMSLWGTRYSSEVNNKKEFVTNFPQYKEQLYPYIKALDNPISIKNYKKMTDFFEKLSKKVEDANKRNGISDTSEPINYENKTDSANVTTKIIEDNNIAYVKVQSFDMDCYKEDKKKLIKFYKKVSNYSNLIIDISRNGGGGMDYFNDLIVSPNINRVINVPVYSLIKAGGNNDKFLKIKEGIKTGLWKPVKELPMLPQMNKIDLQELDYFNDDVYTIKPMGKEKLFKGKIWLLVSEMNYSSSEYAAMVSKYSGFAELVGRRTGGDGIGTDPVYIILPNSGLVVQYSPIYGATADGANSEEFGTKPDILSAEREDPLNTCLKEIRQ
ncbi:S41 family peptidase [Anaerocolumna sp. MB42-C2]|uniref:S41 family peptidase n=1 Tax=Anaerocolumna sp. MB42-C2 TaxID=3070997 RepID=UPI0027DECADB|nr:S41 family peptidase [Anaerocolumna sp. MB42-C2]WMJ89868.1 S41 family peptidase [Anaerocolumna sp. MB42-C2]